MSLLSATAGFQWLALGALAGLAMAVAMWLLSRRLRQAVAARREAAAAQQRSQDRLTRLLRAVKIGIFEHDHLADIVHSSPEHLAIWRFEPGQSPSLSEFVERIHPEDLEQVGRALNRAFDPGSDGLFDSEHRIVWPDGQVRWISVRSLTTFDGEGAARHKCSTVGGVSDITELKNAIQRMRQQASLLDQAQDAITVRDLSGRLVYWNRSAERIYGWTAEEAMGRDAGELLKHDAALALQVRERVLADGEHTAIVPEFRKDGRLLQMEGRFQLMRDEQGRPSGFFAIKTDVTSRLQLEQQLSRAQRLEAVGQLTGGVAHDFNNLLTVILGNADLLAEQLTQQPHLLPLAEMTRQAAQQGADLTHRLLAFSRRQALQTHTVDVQRLLTGLQALLRRTLREDIELEVVLGAGAWPALVDPAQLEAALLNLVLNARDAMPQGGKITLEVANAHIDRDYADRHAEVIPGQYTLISLSDTGCGMTPDQLLRAFEPFFTTKEAGRGTGLGLSMVYGFAKQSNGHVKLYSEPGHGTTVRLYLPRAHDTEPALPPERASAGYDHRGSGVILVVEDDSLVREFAVDVLRRLGYEVLVAEQGAAAMELVADGSAIDLLFTDVVMPGGMNGQQLAEAARALRPDLKVLFTSGYTENAIVHHGRLDRGVHLLQKPYRTQELARKVQEVLTGG